METIAERINNLMDSKGIKGNALADELSVNISTISRILKGTQIPNAETLHRLSQYFNVSMEFILKGEDATFQNCIGEKKLNKKENEFIDHFRELPPEDQDELLAILDIKYQKCQRKKLSNQKSLPSTGLSAG